jgi:hypothetical protein
MSRRNASVVVVVKNLGSNRVAHRSSGLRRSHQGANGRGDERRGGRGTARRATTHLAHRAFVNQISLREYE